MKLFFCPECHDIVALWQEARSCLCGHCRGRYLEDGLHAEITGGAIPIGFDNSSFFGAVLDRPPRGQGRGFRAFVIPIECPTIRVGGKP